MRYRVLVLALLLAALSLRPVLADDEPEIRTLLGREMVTCMVSGGWAVADVGSLQNDNIEVVLLRRYKGQWRRMSNPGNLTRGELMALGMTDQAAVDFGLGEVPEKVITGLRGAMVSNRIAHKNFNIVTYRGSYLAFTSNGARSEGFQIWYYGNRWNPLFAVEPNTAQAEVDKVFDGQKIPRFIEYRLLIGRGTPQ